MRALDFKTHGTETMRQECRFFGARACVKGASFPPVRGNVPERARGLIPGLFGGQPDVAQEVVIEIGEATALAKQGLNLREAVQEPKAASGADGAGGEGAEHGGDFHMMW